MTAFEIRAVNVGKPNSSEQEIASEFCAQNHLQFSSTFIYDAMSAAATSKLAALQILTAGRGPFCDSGEFMHNLVTLTPAERRISAIIDPVIKDMGYQLVRLRIGGGRKKQLQIMAERNDGGMEIDDCTNISKAVSAILDVEDPISGSYTLEISSPGIDRPLTRLSDFSTWKGHLAKLETVELINGRRRFKGIIGGTEGAAIQVATEEGEFLLEFTLVSNARLVLTDRLLNLSASKRKH